MSVDPAELSARVALSRLVEPGHLGVARLVADIGAVELHRSLRKEISLPRLHDDLGARLREIEPERELEQADRLGIRFRSEEHTSELQSH